MTTEGNNEFSSEDISSLTKSVIAGLGPLEAEFKKARQQQVLGIFLIVAGFLLPNVIALLPESIFLIIFAIACTGYLIIKGFILVLKQLAVFKKYNLSVNKLVFAAVLEKLGLAGVMTENPVFHNSDLSKSILSDLDSSELITESHNTNQVDNVINLTYKDAQMQIAELDVKHVTGSGKNRSTKKIFHGYFVYFTLTRELDGKTFVSADSDRTGFGNLSMLFGTETIKETILEWNEFEDMLHVATNDEVEARYILTPNFMHDLYTWWQGREVNIRMSFIKNRLYILYPDDNIRLNTSLDKITDETVAAYVNTIVWPLKNVIKLIDDVRL